MELLVGPDEGVRTAGHESPAATYAGVCAQNHDAHTTGSRAKLVLNEQHVPGRGRLSLLDVCFHGYIDAFLVPARRAEGAK